MVRKTCVISGFPAYAVGNDGVVERISAGRTGAKAGPLRSSRAGAGYRAVTLYGDAGKVQFYVHRLVAEAFVPNPQCLPEVNHDDGDKSNNHWTNLVWSDRSSNNLHKARVLKKINGKRRFIVTQPGHEPVEVDNLAEFIEPYGLHHGACIHVAQGRRTHHHGWHFAYAD